MLIKICIAELIIIIEYYNVNISINITLQE